MYQQQHIADDRGVHTSVKQKWFFDSNKARCLRTITHSQPLSTQLDPRRIFVRFWEVSNTHELQIALQFHQYYGWAWACYSTLVLLRITSRLIKYSFTHQPGRKEGLYRKQRIELDIKERLQRTLAPLRRKQLRVSERKRGKFQACFLSVYSVISSVGH